MDPPENLDQFSKEKQPPELKISAFSIASIRHPERNEDSWNFDQERAIADLFDGMGGKVSGDKASSVAKEVVAERLRNTPKLESVNDWKDYIAQALREANRRVTQEVPGGGTTATVLKVINTKEGQRAIIGNVGNSRAYLLRDGRLQQITEDDNVVSTLSVSAAEKARINRNLDNVKTSADLARLSDLEKDCFRLRSILSQALGGSKGINPHIYEVSIRAGDRIILTSDGVHDNLTASELQNLVALPPADLGGAINAKAFERSKMDRGQIVRANPDDISSIVIEIGGNVGKDRPGRYDAVIIRPQPERRAEQQPREKVYDLKGGRKVSLETTPGQQVTIKLGSSTTLRIVSSEYLIKECRRRGISVSFINVDQLLVDEDEFFRSGGKSGFEGLWPGKAKIFGREQPGRFKQLAIDKTISRAHFLVRRGEKRPDSKDEYLIDDLNSANGTKVKLTYAA